MFQLTKERQEIFDTVDKRINDEVREKVKIINLGKEYDLPPEYDQIYGLKFSDVEGCHYGNVFTKIIEDLEKTGIKIRGKVTKVDPKHTILVETTSGNAGYAFANAVNQLNAASEDEYEFWVIMADGFHEKTYTRIEDLGGKIIRSPKKDYVKGMAKLLGAYLRTNKERLEKKEKTLACANHSVGYAHITSARMKNTVEHALNNCDVPFNKGIATFGNGASITAMGESLKKRYPNCRIIGTADFVYGHGYDVFAKLKQLPSYEQLYSIPPGTLFKGDNLLLRGSNTEIDVKLPLQERAYTSVIDNYVLCTHQALRDAYRKTKHSKEQLQNMLNLPRWDNIPDVLAKEFGPTSRANIMTAVKFVKPGENVLVFIYDTAELYS